jgi:hypothetical protein
MSFENSMTGASALVVTAARNPSTSHDTMLIPPMALA